MRVLLGGQVQIGVCGAEVAQSAAAVGEPLDADVAENGAEGAGLLADDMGTWHALGIDDRGSREGLLTDGPQIHAVLQQLLQHCAPLVGEQVFQVGMRYAVGVRRLQSRHQFVELGP